MKPISAQPEFIDCQRELLGLAGSVRRKEERLKTWLAVAIVCAVVGWGVVGILIWMRASS